MDKDTKAKQKKTIYQMCEYLIKTKRKPLICHIHKIPYFNGETTCDCLRSME